MIKCKKWQNLQYPGNQPEGMDMWTNGMELSEVEGGALIAGLQITLSIDTRDSDCE